MIYFLYDAGNRKLYRFLFRDRQTAQHARQIEFAVLQREFPVPVIEKCHRIRGFVAADEFPAARQEIDIARTDPVGHDDVMLFQTAVGLHLETGKGIISAVAYAQEFPVRGKPDR